MKYWENSTFVNVSEIPKKVDVIIIGGGIVGLSTLFSFIERHPQLSVLLLEADNVGSKASGNSSGQLVLQPKIYFHEMEMLYGLDFARSYYLLLKGSIEKIKLTIKQCSIDADLEECGGMRLATTPGEDYAIRKEFEWLVMNDHDCVFVEKDNIRSMMNSDIFMCGLFDPTEAIFNPARYINGLADILKEYIYCGKRVTSLSKYTATLEDGTKIKFGKVIHCTNAYCADLVPELKNIITPFRGQMISFPKTGSYSIPSFSYSINNTNEYFRFHEDQILIGGCRKLREQSYSVFSTPPDREVTNDIFDFAKILFSGKIKVNRFWDGIMASTHNGLPIVEKRDGHENQFIAVGFNGLGISHSFMAAGLICDII